MKAVLVELSGPEERAVVAAAWFFDLHQGIAANLVFEILKN